MNFHNNLYLELKNRFMTPSGRKKLLFTLFCSLLFILSLNPSIQQYYESKPCVAPEGCQCTLTSFTETIKDQEVTCDYIRITQDPNSDKVCKSLKDEKICRFPVHCGILEGGCDDYDCDTDDTCLEDGSCLYTPKPCRDDDGCCPRGCLGWDNDCPTPEGCVVECRDDCTNLCAGFTELKYFICDFCTGEECEEKCENAKQKQEYMCDVCETTCENSCKRLTCDSSCDGVCDPSCYRADPDCHSCLKGTCDVEKGYCNNCVWDKDTYCSKCNHVGDGECNCGETPGSVDCKEGVEFCDWTDNCVTLNACWYSLGPYCGDVSCTCPSRTITGSGCCIDYGTGSICVYC